MSRRWAPPSLDKAGIKKTSARALPILRWGGRAEDSYIACSNTQAMMARPITDTAQASVRSQGMPIT